MTPAPLKLKNVTYAREVLDTAAECLRRAAELVESAQTTPSHHTFLTLEHAASAEVLAARSLIDTAFKDATT